MEFRASTIDNTRTLLVDANIEHGGKLVEQLNRAGFRTDFAMSCAAARAVLGVNYYHCCVVVADLDRETDLEQIEELRSAAPRVWIVAVSDGHPERAGGFALPSGVDSLLLAPFSVLELTTRLSGLSRRSRPISDCG
jgi:DNA-binding response OmpR family regulator